MAEVVATYDPGADITCEAGVALTGGRCVGLATSRNTGGPTGISDTGDGCLVVPLPTLNGAVFGVASHDAALGKKVNIIRAPKVVPIECSAAIALSAEVSVDAAGTIKTKANGQTPIGVALTATTGSGQYCQVLLYNSPISYA